MQPAGADREDEPLDEREASTSSRARDRPELPLPSVLSSWTRTILDALEALGENPESVLEHAGVSREALRDPNGRLPM
ncbi:MAG TPA: hypothetical protein VGH87_27960, partial [Polyangiaceae bacterium]